MEHIRGIDVMIEVDGEYIAGQQGATLNRSMETLDATSKDSKGWRDRVSGIKEWSIDADGLLVPSDTALCRLGDSFLQNRKVQVRFLTESMAYAGEAYITDFPLEAGFEDLATYSVTLEGCGELVKSSRS